MHNPAVIVATNRSAASLCPARIIVTGARRAIAAALSNEDIPCLASEIRYLHGGHGINH
jgi:hypothetical protein